MAVIVTGLGILFKSNDKVAPTGGYLTYQDSDYGFTIEYPNDWEIKKDTQVFEHGDVISFRKKGPTQKRYTEMIDGAQVAVAKPFEITTDLPAWVKENFDNKAEFSQITVGERVWEKVYICSNGCITYLFTPVGNEIYGVAIFAEGSSQEKMVYENTTLYMFKSLKFKEDEVALKVRALPEVVDYLKRVPNGKVEVNGEEDDMYMVQVYEIKDGHTATFNWYTVNKTTGAVKTEF